MRGLLLMQKLVLIDCPTVPSGEALHPFPCCVRQSTSDGKTLPLSTG
jgi:hypothetical protein